MARTTKQKPAAKRLKDVDSKKLKKDAKAIDENAQRLAVIDANYGANLPYDLNRIIDETRFYLKLSTDAMLEAGQRLILIKEHEQHGAFTKVLEQLDVDPRHARRLMQAAVKFSKRRPVAALGKTKMLELMAEDDDDLDALAKGGTVAGLTLDEIDRMSARELRTKLRAERKKREEAEQTHERQLANKDKKINELDAALHRRDNEDINVQSDELSLQLERETQSVIDALFGLSNMVSHIIAWPDAPMQLKAACVHSANRIGLALHQLRHDYLQHIDVDIDDDSDWIEEAQ